MITNRLKFLSSGEGTTFQQRMADYIRANYAELLGEDVTLLDTPEGLEQLGAILRRKVGERASAERTSAA